MLRNRVLLHRQQELAKLEDTLNELDATDNVEHRFRIQSIRKDKEDPSSRRQSLIDQIDQKLEHYGITRQIKLRISRRYG